MSLASTKDAKALELAGIWKQLIIAIRSGANLTEQENDNQLDQLLKQMADAQFDVTFAWLQENGFVVKTQVVGGSSAGVHSEVGNKKHGLNIDD